MSSASFMLLDIIGDSSQAPQIAIATKKPSCSVPLYQCKYFHYPMEYNMDALELLKQDHQKLKRLFEAVKEATDFNKRRQLFDQIETELEMHAHLEETVFYPAMEEYEQLKDIVAEALQEHQEAKTLLQEIEELGSEREEFDSNLEELMESVEHHVEEEEGEMFPKVRRHLDSSKLEQLGKELEALKGKQHRQASYEKVCK
jgi:iron-sulfur cluster repair protein YtfE (RIC family)